MEYHIARVVEVIKAFGGDVFGEFVIKGIIAGDIAEVRCIDCRVCPEVTPFVSHILMIDYVITHTSSSVIRDNDVTLNIHGYDVWLPSEVSHVPLRLNVTAANRHPWKMHVGSQTFDFDCIAVNCDNMYIRHPPNLGFVHDRLSFTVARIREKHFCLIGDRARTGASMERAVHLVEHEGWHMDDIGSCLDGHRSWIVAKWDALVRAPDSVRIPTPVSGHRVKLDTHATCPLCQNMFDADDVVVNLACNHNFHAYCDRALANDASSSPCASPPIRHGLCAWIRINDSCPCCRARI